MVPYLIVSVSNFITGALGSGGAGASCAFRFPAKSKPVNKAAVKTSFFMITVFVVFVIKLIGRRTIIPVVCIRNTRIAVVVCRESRISVLRQYLTLYR